MTEERLNYLCEKPVKKLTLTESGEIIHFQIEQDTYYLFGIDHTRQALWNVYQACNNYCLLKSYLAKWKKQLQVEGVNSKSMVLNDIQYLLNEVIKNEET